jgi:hypothetical protein
MNYKVGLAFSSVMAVLLCAPVANGAPMMKTEKLASLLGSAGCNFGGQTRYIKFGSAWSFCCAGLDGSKTHNVSATFESMNTDTFKVKAGIVGGSITDSCEQHMSNWYGEVDCSGQGPGFLNSYPVYPGNPQNLPPTNFRIETVAIVFYCESLSPLHHASCLLCLSQITREPPLALCPHLTLH